MGDVPDQSDRKVLVKMSLWAGTGRPTWVLRGCRFLDWRLAQGVTGRVKGICAPGCIPHLLRPHPSNLWPYAGRLSKVGASASRHPKQLVS